MSEGGEDRLAAIVARLEEVASLLESGEADGAEAAGLAEEAAQLSAEALEVTEERMRQASAADD